MSKPKAHLQSCALPFAWEDGDLCLGITTSYRGKNWRFPKVSINESQCPVDAASNIALSEGGFVGLISEESLANVETAKGGKVQFFPLEISGLLEDWEGERHHRRKLVPLSRIEKYVSDRSLLRVVKKLVEDHLGLELTGN